MRSRLSLTTLILLALAAGLVFGAVWPGPSASLAALARLFVRLLQLVVVPLVFSTLAAGVAGSAGATALRRLALGALAYFFLATLAATAIGLVAGNLIQPWLGAPPAAVTGAAPAVVEAPSFVDTLVPTSIVGAMASNNLLGVVAFAVIFALALRPIRDTAGAPVMRLVESLAAVMMRLTTGIMWTAPVAVFAAAAATMARIGWSDLAAVVALFVAGYASILVFGVLLLAVSCGFGRFGPVGFLRATGSAILLAFSTASSAAALPGAMEELERWGASRRTIGFVLPLGFSFNLTGTAAYLPIGVLFWAGLNGVTLGWPDQLMLGLTVFVLIRGLPPIPRGLFLVLGGILARFGLPPEGVVFLLGLDPLLDMARTGMNLGGNCLAVATLARLDQDAPDDGTPASEGT